MATLGLRVRLFRNLIVCEVEQKRGVKSMSSGPALEE